MLKQESQKEKKIKTEEDQKKTKAIKNLELARIAHEKYLIRSYHCDLEEAIEYYINAVKLNPQLAQSYYRLATLLWEDGQICIETAIEHCNMAVKMEPNNPNAHIYLGYFLKIAGRMDEAEKHLFKAIKVSHPLSARPKLIFALNLLQRLNKEKFSFSRFVKFISYFSLSSVMMIWDYTSLRMLYKHFFTDFNVFIFKFLTESLEKINKVDMALSLSQVALNKTGSIDVFFTKIGDLLIKKQEPKLALESYREVLKKFPYNRDALIKIATIDQIYFNENINEAIDCYTKLLEIENEKGNIYYELGHLYLQKDDKINSINSFKLALELNKVNPYIHNSLAYAYVNIGLYEEAIEHYQEAIRINPDNIWTSIVCQALGSLYFEIKNNTELALTLYQTAITLDPKSEEAYIGLGDIYAQTGNLNLAMKNYCEAIQINPNNAKIYGKCGIALWENDYNEEAIIAYNKAIELNKNYDIAYNNLGVIYLDGIGNIKEALKLFKKAIEIRPDYLLANLNAGRASQALNLRKEAADYYKKVLELNKSYQEIDETDILNRLYKLFECDE